MTRLTLAICSAVPNKFRVPWEPTTFIFRGYNQYIGGFNPSFFMVLGSKGMEYWPTFRLKLLVFMVAVDIPYMEPFDVSRG